MWLPSGLHGPTTLTPNRFLRSTGDHKIMTRRWTLRSLPCALLLAALTASCAMDTASFEEDEVFDETDTAISGSYAVGTTLTATGNVNFRSGPSTSTAKLAVVSKGQTVTLLESLPSNGFYNVRFNGKDGWVSGKYLEVSSDPGYVVGARFTTTLELNMRTGPSTDYSVITAVPEGGTVTLLTAMPSNGFLNVSYGSNKGWCSAKYLQAYVEQTGTAIETIEQLAETSSCAAYRWKDRGKAPRGYTKGVALTFARAVCNQDWSDVKLASRAKTGDDAKDALSWYNSVFSNLGMSNSTAGVDTLRHTYALVLGLGLRESSGKHCCGIDASADNTSASTAEAGAWQTSYNSRAASSELTKLFETYRSNPRACFLDTFAEGVSCNSTNWKNWGTGDGVDFQRLEKECPAFAAEYAAVGIRVLGGNKGHWGPLRTRAAEVRTECDSMLKQVQNFVTNTPSACNEL